MLGPAEHVEHVGAALDELEQAAVGVELLRAHVAEEVGRAADVEPLLSRLELGEDGLECVEEPALARRQARVFQAAAQRAGSELHARDGVVEVVARPLREARIDRILEVEEALRDTAGRGDDDDHHELRLQKQHLDVSDMRDVERRRRDEREQPRHLREHLRRRLERRLDLGARGGQVERERGRLRLEVPEELVGEIAVAGLGRDAPRGRVRMLEQAERLQLGKLGADRGRRDAEVGSRDERLRADGRTVATNSSTTRRRISLCRTVSCSVSGICRRF